MNLKYFTKEAYSSLKADQDLNRDKYISGDDWLPDYFKEQGVEEYFKESSIVVKDFDLVYSGDTTEDKNRDDVENVIRLYSAFLGKITPAVASDPSMWSALCHLDYRDYVLQRWKKDDENRQLNQRFLAIESRNSMYYYNALSRLWWSGYLTYEENEEDHWKLTRILFSAQQIQKDLFDQSFSMNKDVVKGLLRALNRMQILKRNACTSLFRKCCHSFLNHYGAVTIVDVLASDEIEKIAYNYMFKEAEAESKQSGTVRKEMISGKKGRMIKKKKKE